MNDHQQRNDDLPEPINVVALASALGIAALTLYLLVVGQSILVPLVLAVFITYLLKALAHALVQIKFRGRSLPESLALTSAIVLFLIAVAVIVQLVAGNVGAIADAAPVYQEKLESLFLEVRSTVERLIGTPLTIAELNERIDIQGVILRLVGAIRSIASNTFLIFLYVAFLLLESRTLHVKIKAFAATPHRETAIKATLTAIGRDIETYVWIKTLMSLLAAGMSYIILVIADVDFAAFWALLIFILNYIPFIGSVVAVAFPVVLSILQFGSIALTGVVLVGLMAVQLVVGNVIEPRMTGTSLNLSPVIIILALSVWGAIWGVTGMILSVPIMVMGMIVLAQFPRTKPLAVLMSQSGEIK